ncbi:TMhelix containing protein [Vibrio phage 1.224.A._10N.261.48.B1]|uniref:TMhelix containing protein n=1 Tax=Vibrio phage 1.224.A._10N.261.48.B1 TaxID=1881226 RepID=A0A2I7RRY8_9CAUD|nr:TMhelix containing protein [Vibrio phage 1.224.A._10N.261.48.B1]AUR96408.1 TMhelix containing protein [Vibrio phage 1.224.A._10N.261.48.B1]
MAFPVSSMFSFLGTLVPVLFPKNEFQPKRLGAVILFLIVCSVMVHVFGVETTSDVIELSSDAMKLTEE